jgi:hypothetical protein
MGTPPEIKLTVNYRVPCPLGRKRGTPPELKLTVNYRVPHPHGRKTGTPPELKLTVNYRVPCPHGRKMGTASELKLTVNYRVPCPHGRKTGTPPELKLTVNYRCLAPEGGGWKAPATLGKRPWEPGTVKGQERVFRKGAAKRRRQGCGGRARKGSTISYTPPGMSASSGCSTPSNWLHTAGFQM